MVRFTLPRWPDMRLPGNTRPGSCAMPIEPELLCESELPCEARFEREVVALDHAGVALADRGAGNIDLLPGCEHVDLELGADLEVADASARDAELAQLAAGFDARLGEVARHAPCSRGVARRLPNATWMAT